jgi:hypothetical protein
MLSLLRGGYHLRRCYEHMEKVYSRRSGWPNEVATVILRTVCFIADGRPNDMYGVVDGDRRGLGEVMVDIGVKLSVPEESILLALRDTYDTERSFRDLIEIAKTLHGLDEATSVTGRAAA